jgi:hypothetical protein
VVVVSVTLVWARDDEPAAAIRISSSANRKRLAGHDNFDK